jgi:hypothetical protein
MSEVENGDRSFAKPAQECKRRDPSPFGRGCKDRDHAQQKVAGLAVSKNDVSLFAPCSDS